MSVLHSKSWIKIGGAIVVGLAVSMAMRVNAQNLGTSVFGGSSSEGAGLSGALGESIRSAGESKNPRGSDSSGGFSPTPSTPVPAEPGTSSAPAAPAADPSVLIFQPDPAVSAQVKQQFLTQIDSGDTGGSILREAFASVDIIGAFAQDLSVYGMEANNIGDVMAGYLIVMWTIVNDAPVPPNYQVLAIRQQIQDVLVTNPNVINASDADKQQIAENWIYEQALARTALEFANASNDPQSKQQLQQIVYEGVLSSGIDLRNWTITDQGFASQ
jgi:hypothetical protein